MSKRQKDNFHDYTKMYGYTASTPYYNQYS